MNHATARKTLWRTQGTGAVAWVTKVLAIGVIASAQQVPHPNFIFIQGEGQGWNSTSVRMDPEVEGSRSEIFRMPSLERLAAGGMRFARFYAPSPRCTPSRATFFTGKSPAQLRMTFVSLRSVPNTKVTPPEPLLEMPLEETTIAELLNKEGYGTAHFGKWHVGRIHPSRHGFDESDGATRNGGPENVRSPNPKQAYGITERGMDFMTRQIDAGKPFFVQLSHYAGRGAQAARQETFQKVLSWTNDRRGRDAGAAAVAFDMDITIGMILDKLDELGAAGNTYVIYTADHGTPGRSNGPLANGKGTVWEGGLRVPLVIRGPGIEAGTVSRVRATGADLFPTIAELAGVERPVPTGIEGGSLAALLKNSGQGVVERKREELVFHFPHYDSDPLGPASAILMGNYKLICFYESGERRLFDLSTDPGERHNLSAEMAEKAEELDQRLTEYLESVNAQTPVMNASFDPSRPVSEVRRRGGRGRRGQGRGGGRPGSPRGRERN